MEVLPTLLAALASCIGYGLAESSSESLCCSFGRRRFFDAVVVDTLF